MGGRRAFGSVSPPGTGSGYSSPGRYRKLAFDHDEIVTAAVDATRKAYAARPDPDGLLGEEFTLLELYQVHAAVLGPLTRQKDTFRRHMIHQLTTAAGSARHPSANPPASSAGIERERHKLTAGIEERLGLCR